MFNKVMVPLDGSQAAESALNLAKTIVDSTNGVLLLIRVVKPGKVKEAAKYLQKKQRLIQSENQQVDILVVEGTAVVNAILSTAEEEQVDVIAMSTTGLGGVGQIKLGAITSRILQESEIPVFVSRLPEKYG